MARFRVRLALLIPLAFMTACASAEDRLAEGVALQRQGRYIDAVYRYVEAVDKDPNLLEAQERLLAAGDTAVQLAMDDADELERRGDPVESAGLYRRVDRMLAAGRQVGVRIPIPSDYSAIRRGILDSAINWLMVEGDEAAAEGRFQQARQSYVAARGDYLPSRNQIEESFDAEERVLLEWSEVELGDGAPRHAHGLAQQAMELRNSPARETVLAVRDLQARALEAGTQVIAIVPVVADPGVREFLGGEFEIELDDVLALDHWTRPPPFVEIADPILLRRELRGLLRGQLAQSPTVVGRALDLIGADIGVMVRINEIEVVELDVDQDDHEAIIPADRRTSSQTRGRGRGTEGPPRPQGSDMPMDTVTYTTIEGDLRYYVKADIILVAPGGRELTRFEASSTQAGPFQRGEFDGDPRRLDLDSRRAPFFDPAVLTAQRAAIEGIVLEELAGAVAIGTYDQVLAGIR